MSKKKEQSRYVHYSEQARQMDREFVKRSPMAAEIKRKLAQDNVPIDELIIRAAVLEVECAILTKLLREKTSSETFLGQRVKDMDIRAHHEYTKFRAPLNDGRPQGTKAIKEKAADRHKAWEEIAKLIIQNKPHLSGKWKALGKEVATAIVLNTFNKPKLVERAKQNGKSPDESTLRSYFSKNPNRLEENSHIKLTQA